MKFTIWTEDKDEESTQLVTDLVQGAFKSFSVFKGEGHWNWVKEKSLQVVIFAPGSDSAMVYEIAREIKKRNEQEAVLVTLEQTEEEVLI